MRRSHSKRILQGVPVLVLLAVASVNILLVNFGDLDPWMVGGFGMFSSTDNRANRRIDASALVQGERVPLKISLYKTELGELRVLPTDFRLTSFLSKLACDRRVVPQGATSIRLSFYKLQVDKATVTPRLWWRKSANVCPD